MSSAVNVIVHAICKLSKKCLALLSSWMSPDLNEKKVDEFGSCRIKDCHIFAHYPGVSVSGTVYGKFSQSYSIFLSGSLGARPFAQEKGDMHTVRGHILSNYSAAWRLH